MRVMKFGGTSVGSASAIQSVGEIVRNALPYRPVVVVSAVAGVTNLLLEMRAAPIGAARQVVFDKILSTHKTIIAELEVDDSVISDLFDELKNLQNSGQNPDEMMTDYLISFGERMSARIVAAYLRNIGVDALSYEAGDLGMITDSRYGRAEPLPQAYDILQKSISVIDCVPVITGFIGKTTDGKYSTLGRGGSDYSAAIIGAAIQAERIQIWKDVDGILTADPRVIPCAKIVRELAFEEAGELAYFGAKVLHPKAILPAMKVGVPVQVLNTFDPDGSGTTIVTSFAQRKSASQNVEAITHKNGVVIVQVYSPEFFDGNGLFARVVEIFNKYRTSIDIVATSVASVSVTTDNTSSLDMIVRDLKELGEVSVEYGKAVVCVVGGGVDSAGVSGRMFTVLGNAGVCVEMISQASAGISMTFVVNEKDAIVSVRELHKEYIEK